MASIDELRKTGLLEARVPRYTSYPPANHFDKTVGGEQVATWLQAVPQGASVSLYLHIPYCRRLCWFCACRTQGTKTDRPLAPYLDLLLTELATVGRHLRPDVTISQIHLGGGTPTMLPPDMIRTLGAALRSFRTWDADMIFSVEIDPTEVDQARIDALAEIGMTRASIGVQDFDPKVQESIGRGQSYAQTRDVVDMLRGAGVRSLNMDLLYGLPHQDNARMVDTVQKVLSLAPDRVALYGYAHVPWMAKRQVMIPADALPDAEARLELFEVARRLFAWDGYRSIGIDHFAREGDDMANADRLRTLRRNFQGYTVDGSDVLIGLGASAVSRYPQGFAQNVSASSHYALAVQDGELATIRGHTMTPDDKLRGAMIQEIMCRFTLNLDTIAAQFDVPLSQLEPMVAPMLTDFASQLVRRGNVITIVRDQVMLARMVAHTLDTYAMPEGRHSRAM